MCLCFTRTLVQRSLNIKGMSQYMNRTVQFRAVVRWSVQCRLIRAAPVFALGLYSAGKVWVFWLVRSCGFSRRIL